MSNGGGSFRITVEEEKSCCKSKLNKCSNRTLHKINFNKINC